MTRKELLYIREVLTKIKNPDGRVTAAIAMIDKRLAMYDATKGQLRDNYETMPW